jgi:hypothetical protein
MRRPSAAAPTFADLFEAMDAAGVEVRVAVEGGRPLIRLVDHHGVRSLDVPVSRGFDRQVAAICCSLALCADVPGFAGPGVALARRWPELAALAREVLTRPARGR